MSFFLLSSGFNVDAYNKQTPSSASSNQSQIREGWLQQINDLVPVFYEWGVLIFTFLFIVSIIGMIVSLILKHGQWMKWSSSTMMFTFITVLLLRIGPIFALTINTTDITLLLTKVISFLQEFVLYTAIVAILIGIFYRSFYKIHQHNGYDRWSKGLFVGASILVVLSFVTPYLMGSVIE